MAGAMRVTCVLAIFGMLLMVPPSEAFLELLLKDDLVRLFLGTSTPFYLVEEGYDSQLARSGVLQYLPALEPERSRLTFEWSAKKQVHYIIHTHSGDTNLMRVPRASIPLASTVPLKQTEFSIDFPCTGHTGGTTYLAITFAFYDDSGRPLYNEPFTLAMARQCAVEKLDVTRLSSDISRLPDSKKETLHKLLGHDIGSAHHLGGNKAAHILQDPKSGSNIKPHIRSHQPTISVPVKKATKPLTTKPPIEHITKAEKVVTTPPKEETATTARASRPVKKSCRMCDLPTDLFLLKKTICKSAFAIRTRLDAFSKITSPNRLFLSLRDVKELHTSRSAVALAIKQLHSDAEHSQPDVRMRLNAGKPGVCACHKRINNRDLYLIAGKFSSRRGELIVRHNNGLIVPWREAKRMIRQLRPLRCNK